MTHEVDVDEGELKIESVKDWLSNIIQDCANESGVLVSSSSPLAATVTASSPPPSSSTETAEVSEASIAPSQNIVDTLTSSPGIVDLATSLSAPAAVVSWLSRSFSNAETIPIQPNLAGVSQAVEATSENDRQVDEECGDRDNSNPSKASKIEISSSIVHTPIDGEQCKFEGRHPQQYALWGHNMALYAAFIGIVLGLATFAWAEGVAQGWNCTINGRAIDSSLVVHSDIKECLAEMPETNSSSVDLKGTSNTVHEDFGGCCPASAWIGKDINICCNPAVTADVNLGGSIWIGIYTVLLSLCIGLLENAKFGFGLWQPSDTLFYRYRWSPLATMYIILVWPLFGAIPSAFAGLCILMAAIVQQHSFWRFESGDGGRLQTSKARKHSVINSCSKKATSIFSCICDTLTYPSVFCCSLYREENFSVMMWLLVYAVINIVIFLYSLTFWDGAIAESKNELFKGKVDLELHTNIAMVRFGLLSRAGPWAKAAGACLNFNCALIVMPVTKLLHSRALANSPRLLQCIFGFLFGSPFKRLIVVSKHVSFHKLIGKAIFLFVWLHTIAHLINYAMASRITLTLFEQWGSKYLVFFTGFALHIPMFFMYTALSKKIREAKYEIFIRSHYLFIAFFVILLLHAPFYWVWSLIPLTLFALERIIQKLQGKQEFELVRAEWVAPILCLKFRPLNKKQFEFREGQYVLLNVPHVSRREWHPFTISSTRGDLSIPGSGIINYASRVSLRTGEELYEVPRPKNIGEDEPWAKYCPMSINYKDLRNCELHDKHDTCRCEYVSCHIKVYGLNDTKAKTWTRKLKEHIECLGAGQSYPLHFTHRDEYGDLKLGRQFGVDPCQQILHVDGPYSTPTDRFTDFNTIMLIGACNVNFIHQ
jgi:hypothetical protein